MQYRILYSDTSRNQIGHLHPELRAVIRKRLKELAENPYVGKRLEKELSEYFSLRARRFRIIYKVKERDKVLEIHYVGCRKDIYELVKGKMEND
ncbi:MAG: type II toxin-antitoxin system RelE/ParE family toxin [Proteobacteria bacterium]|nr:type II toxin-antitoxin system RelE/ParE family toxin [Pseudomonadota bacterium]